MLGVCSRPGKHDGKVFYMRNRQAGKASYQRRPFTVRMEQCNRVGRVFLVENNIGKGRRCGPAWREEIESSDFLDELPWWLQRWPMLQFY